MSISVFDPTPCQLGEGPLWHPSLGCLFWFDILGKRLFQRTDKTRHWNFDEIVTAAGWIDDDRLLIASETRLFTFSLSTEAKETVCLLESDNPDTRSNDGRADPFGGFWIGTMGKSGQKDAGAFYRFYKGELRQLFAPISTTNAICFSPDGTFAYFADTPTHIIQRVALDSEGWPNGDPEPWLDLSEEALRPDGAVTDAAGNLWNAQWGAARIACYSPDAKLLETIAIPANLATCPAFGGADLTTLFCTSASVKDDGPAAGQTFAIETAHKGRPEPAVII